MQGKIYRLKSLFSFGFWAGTTFCGVFFFLSNFLNRMDNTRKGVNALSFKVVGAAIEVHKHLGPGLLESIYQKCLAIELLERGINFQQEVEIPISYKGHLVQGYLKCDFFIENYLDARQPSSTENNGFFCYNDPPLMIGQIHFADVDEEYFTKFINENKQNEYVWNCVYTCIFNPNLFQYLIILIRGFQI